jgi:Zn finger protein HypA/HybF involved in hydrogenase expression
MSLENLKTIWMRKCQECGYMQQAKPPKEYKTDEWRNLKCKRCKSMAMDYGKEYQVEIK